MPQKWQRFFPKTCLIWQVLHPRSFSALGIRFPLNLFFMASLSNYLRTHRKRLALSQEEVAFLLGAKGMDKGIKVSRDENHARKTNLETALAYQVIYGIPVGELFAGLYAQVEREVKERAKVLHHRNTGKSNLKRAAVITKLVSILTA